MYRRLIIVMILSSVVTGLRAQQPTPAQRASANNLLSDEVNGKFPKWLRVGAEYRARVEGFAGGAFRSGNEDEYLLSRLRINLFLLPTSWMKLGFQGQDTRVFWKNQNPAVPPYQDSLDLRQAYIELGDLEKKNFGIRAGRQELAFGDERLIGNANWLNAAPSFDAVRGTIRHGAFRADVFAARVVKQQDSEFDWSTPGNNFYGIYTAIEKLVPNATVEPYFLWRRQSGLRTELGTPGISTFGTFGVRWVGQLSADFDYGTEMDRQAGSLGTDTIGSWAGHWVLGKTLAKTRFKPRFSVEYNYASGDRNSSDGRRSTFDQLYSTGHDKYGLADQVGWRNIRNARIGVDLKLARKWTSSERYNAWWLADPHDALYNAAGAIIVRTSSGTSGRFVGQELDSVLAYTFSKYLQIGGGFGHIFPGTFLSNTTPAESYNFPYASMNLIF